MADDTKPWEICSTCNLRGPTATLNNKEYCGPHYRAESRLLKIEENINSNKPDYKRITQDVVNEVRKIHKGE